MERIEEKWISRCVVLCCGLKVKNAFLLFCCQVLCRFIEIKSDKSLLHSVQSTPDDLLKEHSKKLSFKFSQTFKEIILHLRILQQFKGLKLQRIKKGMGRI